MLHNPRSCSPKHQSRRYSATRRFASLLLIGLSSFGSVLLGCSGDTTGAAAVLAPSDLFWSLRLNYHAVNLANVSPYDTVRLIATALDAAGNVITNAGPVTFHAADSTVTVDSTGLVTAHYTTSSVSFPTSVVTVLSVKGVTHRDTALFQVVSATPAPVPLATFSIQPAAGDSAKLAYDGGLGGGGFKTIAVFATDNAGNVMRDASVNQLLVSFTSSNERLATINQQTGDLQAILVGHVTLYASTYAYGVAARDSLPFVIGYPIDNIDNSIFYCGDTTSNSAWFVDHFTPASKVVGVGGTVRFFPCQEYLEFRKPAADTLDIVFDDATVVPGGTVLIPGNVKNFVITKTGTFHYHSARYGGSGTIIVAP